MLLQPTSPFRGADDVRDAVALMDDALCPAVVSVCEDTHSPFFSLRIAENGALERLFMDAPVATRRQDLPSTYHINGAIYLSRTEVFLRTRSFLPEGTQPLVMPAERSIDIDTAFDFALCEALLSIQSDQFIRRDRPSPGL
jgi:N-acylneuraminate cytidylyltransferase